MRDKSKRIIYVGKAKNLPKRVQSYFQKTAPSPRISLMVTQIQDFDFVVTGTEKEALILENSLIKKHHPKFNVVLRDDKTYPSLRLSVTEPFPRLEIVRRPEKDGSIIYGPFPSANALKDTLKLVNRLFPLRRCRRPDVKKTTRPCLNYQIGLCVGPCRPDYTPEEYQKLTLEVRLFFRGKKEELIAALTKEMHDKAAAFEFEAAAFLRDRLYNLEKTLEHQVVSNHGDKNLDVWALAHLGGLTGGAVLNIRQGAVLGCQPIFADGGFGSPEGTEEEKEAWEAQVLVSLITQYYAPQTLVPEEILLPVLPNVEEGTLLGEFLQNLAGKKVKLSHPLRGDRLKLLDMAHENALAILTERLERLTRTSGVLAELQNRLKLPNIPRRIECFDLAHLQGQAAVAGMVVMLEGEFYKKDYRKFKIKESLGGDDYEGMREVIRRRFTHSDNPDKWPTPDLLLLDGGRGQIASALKAFRDLQLTPPPLAGIAKDRPTGGPDRIFVPGRKNPADIKPESPPLLLLAKLRDEAHRFCRTYHHKLRAQESVMGVFSNIKGIGPARAKALAKAFETMNDLENATDQEILKIAPISPESLLKLRKTAREFLTNRNLLQ
jgi:excinuclease ABC subunit C